MERRGQKHAAAVAATTPVAKASRRALRWWARVALTAPLVLVAVGVAASAIGGAGGWGPALAAASTPVRCLVAETERSAFVNALVRGARLDDQDGSRAADFRRMAHGVLDSNEWREYLQREMVDYGDVFHPIPGTRFRVVDAAGDQVIPEEFIPLSADNIVHFALEFRKILAGKYGDWVRYSNNPQQGCFGVARIGDVKTEESTPQSWKIVVKSGDGKVLADDKCVRKDMRVWDQYVVSFVKTS